MTLWCLFASNLMLGSDLRNISATTLNIISNHEVLAVNRDPLGSHGRLVYDHTSPAPPPPPGPPLPPVPLQCAAGALAPGEFIRIANSTIVAAIKYCSSNTKCGGFTTKASSCDPAAGGVHEVYYKSDLGDHNSDPIWQTWKKPNWVPPPPPPRLQIFAKLLADGSHAVAVLNRGAATIDVRVTWEMIQAGGGTFWKRAKARDLWRHKDLGTFNFGLTIEDLESHATSFLIVTPV